MYYTNGFLATIYCVFHTYTSTICRCIFLNWPWLTVWRLTDVSDVSINYMSMVIASYKFTHECDNFILPSVWTINIRSWSHHWDQSSGSCSLDIHYDIYDNYKWVSILGKHPAFRHSSERFDTQRYSSIQILNINEAFSTWPYATHWGYE
jgi:hypothetical protein